MSGQQPSEPAPEMPEVIEARRALMCLHIAVEQPVATDVQRKVEAAFAAFARQSEALEARVEKAERLSRAMVEGWLAREEGKPDPDDESAEGQMFSKGWQWRDDALARQQAEALAERERARADDHDSARQSEKERADYAEARLAEATTRGEQLCNAYGTALMRLHDLQSQLAALTGKRDMWERTARNLWEMLPLAAREALFPAALTGKDAERKVCDPQEDFDACSVCSHPASSHSAGKDATNMETGEGFVYDGCQEEGCKCPATPQDAEGAPEPERLPLKHNFWPSSDSPNYIFCVARVLGADGLVECGRKAKDHLPEPAPPDPPTGADGYVACTCGCADCKQRGSHRYHAKHVRAPLELCLDCGEAHAPGCEPAPTGHQPHTTDLDGACAPTGATEEQRAEAGGLSSGYVPAFNKHSYLPDIMLSLILARDKAQAELARVGRLEKALRSIAVWSQPMQDDAEQRQHGIALWRGCVAEARAALAAESGAEEKEG